MESGLAKKKAVRREWTKDDVRQMKMLAKQRVGAPTIAKKLKRTLAAVKMRASVLGVSLDTRGWRSDHSEDQLPIESLIGCCVT